MSTTFAQLVAAAQGLSEYLTDAVTADLLQKDIDAINAFRLVIDDFTQHDLLPNDEAATIGGLFAKLAAFREAKNQDGLRVYEAENKLSDEKEKVEHLLERLKAGGIAPDEDPKP